MKKNVVIVILVMLVLGMGAYLVYDKVVDKEIEKESKEKKQEDKKGAIKEEEKGKYKEYKKGEEIVDSNSNRWLVLADSDSNQDYVVLLGRNDYSDELQGEEWFNVSDELFNEDPEYSTSDLRKFMDSKATSIPFELKEIDGYKIRLVTLEEMLAIDDNWDYVKEEDLYVYTDDINKIHEYLESGLMSMTKTKCSPNDPNRGGKCWAFYVTSGTECYGANCTRNFYITNYNVGIVGLKPVVNVLKSSLQ